jgi:hypothetical protein
VIGEARELGQKPTDKSARQALMQRRTRLKLSKDWFDQAVIDRWQLDEERRKAEQKES